MTPPFICFISQVAGECDRPDLQQVWSLAAVVASSPAEDPLRPWAAHPCGRSLLASILAHHLAIKDFQTAALLICVFGNKAEFTPRYRLGTFLRRGLVTKGSGVSLHE